MSNAVKTWPCSSRTGRSRCPNHGPGGLNRVIDHIGDPSVADAILDRLMHNAYNLDIKGPSQRKENSSKMRI